MCIFIYEFWCVQCVYSKYGYVRAQGNNFQEFLGTMSDNTKKKQSNRTFSSTSVHCTGARLTRIANARTLCFLFRVLTACDRMTQQQLYFDRLFLYCKTFYIQIHTLVWPQ